MADRTYADILNDTAHDLECDANENRKSGDSEGEQELLVRAAQIRSLAELLDQVIMEDAESLSDELHRLHGPKMDGPRNPLETALLHSSELISRLCSPLSDS